MDYARKKHTDTLSVSNGGERRSRKSMRAIYDLCWAGKTGSETSPLREIASKAAQKTGLNPKDATLIQSSRAFFSNKLISMMLITAPMTALD